MCVREPARLDRRLYWRSIGVVMTYTLEYLASRKRKFSSFFFFYCWLVEVSRATDRCQCAASVFVEMPTSAEKACSASRNAILPRQPAAVTIFAPSTGIHVEAFRHVCFTLILHELGPVRATFETGTGFLDRSLHTPQLPERPG